ncbi:c-type cytochrome [Sulfurimonas paralvinellae]|uniref:Cytochrome c n=1 Tax=Sulfurimonas paralvinellae TaxID=317658 RepID=A0A7M1B9V5_9BACT|nr:c-type cytochrome [Sulfurimonas paralvinellae]QOP45618.1 cytochrome c [Sulfurimonas paralvinellae]
MKYILLLLTPWCLFASSSFITQREYASQLYKNPRGIACGRCHGAKGEGKLIANYVHKNKKKSFIGPRINNIKYTEFFKALNTRKKGMPRYYLTPKEIEALYFYLHQNDKKKVKNVQ